MTTTDPNSSSIPIQDRRIKPTGILPRNIQAWVIAGIAALMVLVIALTGRNPSNEHRVSTPPVGAGIIDPNAARIQDYQKRIEDQARKLQDEQAQLARTQQTVTGTPYPPAGPPPYTFANGSLGGRAEVSENPYELPELDAEIQKDKQKREYESLFASNIALTYRRDPATAQESRAAPSSDLSAKNLSYGYPLSASSATEMPPISVTSRLAPVTTPRDGATDPGSSAAGSREPSPAQDRSALERARNADAEFGRATGKQYRLFEGTVLETVLTNRLDGYFSGPVNCMVTTDVYSHNGQRLLVPQGSRVLGEVRRVDTFGQQRLAVFFHRLIMPDGYVLSLDKFEGLNQIGETGLVDLVNHHYLQMFGVSLAIGAIAGLSQVNTSYGVNESAADAYRQGVSTSLSQSSLHILDRYLNVLPTFTIREGQRVKICLSNDLLLPAYENHQMPNDL